MPVFDQGYAPLDEPPRAMSRVWPIYASLVAPAFRRRVVLAILAMSLTKLGVQVVLIQFKLSVGKLPFKIAQLPTDSAQGMVQFVTGAGQWGGQWLWVALGTLVVGAGAIAHDQRTGALRLYFSRPITRGDYALAKCLGVGTFVALVSVVPGLLLVAFHALATKDTVHVDPGGATLPALLAAGALLVALSSLAMVALSALVRSARVAGIAWLAWLVIGDWVAWRHATPDNPWIQAVSLLRLAGSLGERMLMDAGAEVRFDVAPLDYGTIALAGSAIATAAMFVIWLRLREVRR